MEEINTGLLDFLNRSHSEFNATYNLKKILLDNGYIELKEEEPFNLVLGHNYFLVRNDSSLVAIKLPKKLSDYHFLISASHSDSPSLKLKMCDDVISNNYHKLAVEVYGGLIRATYLDKPLSIAGRVIVKENNKLVTKIIDVDKNLVIIPNLCIHFNREINKGIEYNPQVDLMALISNDNTYKNSIKEAIKRELKVKEEDIVSYDLNLYNREKSTLGGLDNEFIMSGRIDNLENAYLGIKGFIDSNIDGYIGVYSVFNNEEVGSSTINGADSDLLINTLERINLSINKSSEEFKIALHKSFILSCDNGHAVHPNHSEVSDPNNLCYLNKGIIIKFNSDMAYTSDALSSSIVKSLCENNHIPYQYFYNKSDVRGGSTLGAISLTHLSILSCDIGLAQLAMHSNYEVAGSKDTQSMYNLIKAFYSTNIEIKTDEIKV
jgi:aspartyl aminopeptidase